MAKLGGAPASHASMVTPLSNGIEAWNERLALVREAKSYVVLTVYHFDADDYAIQFLNELTAAAKRGVKVAIAYDYIATASSVRKADEAQRAAFDKAIRDLKRAGGSVAVFGSVHEQLTEKFAQGMHSKALVVDGTAIVGGRNVSEKYFAKWLDFEAKLTGSVAVQLAEDALAMIAKCEAGVGLPKPIQQVAQHSLNDKLRRIALDLALTPRDLSPGGPRFVLVSHDPTHDQDKPPHDVTEALIATIDRAANEIVLSSNYVSATPALTEALLRAASRGVKIKIVTNGEAAGQWKVNQVLHRTAEREYKRLMAAGIEIYETTTRYSHTKLVVVDQTIGTFGSYNFERPAEKKLSENLLISDDPRIVQALYAQWTALQQQHCVRYQPTPKTWRQRFKAAFLTVVSTIVRNWV